MRVRIPSVTTSMRVSLPTLVSVRVRYPTVRPTPSCRNAAMRCAAARAARRRGSSMTMRLLPNQDSSSSAGGTTVVFPAPGGACTTTAPARESADRISSSDATMGRSIGMWIWDMGCEISVFNPSSPPVTALESTVMPEFPDITVYIEALAARILGKAPTDVRIVNPFVLRTVDPRIDRLVGARVTGFRRMGKRIVIEFEGGLFLVIHLMIAGRLRWRAPGGKVTN